MKTVTIWSYRWRQAIHEMKWVSEGAVPADMGETMLARHRQREPKVRFVLTDGSVPAG